MSFRQHHSKSFGNRGSDLPNPWMTEEDIFNMRRQNPHFLSPMQNMAPATHSQFPIQNAMLSPSNKNFINQGSNLNFTISPNTDIFQSPHSMNDAIFSSRLTNDRFSNNPYAYQNSPNKINEGHSLYNDLPTPRNDGFPESAPKLFPNMRQPTERFSCMQKDQAHFRRKYDEPPIFQGKDFPFSSKEMQSQPVAFIDKAPVSASNKFASCKSNYKPPSLFPAYTPKENNDIALQKSQNVPEETSKRVHQSAYSSEFTEKSYCDKTECPPQYLNTVETVQGKTGSFQDRNVTISEAFSTIPTNTTSSYVFDKSSFKSLSPIPQDSLKTLENTVSSANTKFPFSAGSQDACFQSSRDNPFQKSQTMHIQNTANATVSRDCLMQNAPFSGSETSLSHQPNSTNNTHQSAKHTFSSFDTSLASDIHHSTKETHSSFNVSSQSDIHPSSKDTFLSSFNVSSESSVHQSSKEGFSFNFENNMNNPDISDLLPGLDAFLKETLKSVESSKPGENLNKSLNVVTDFKDNTSKSSVPTCAFTDDDEWSKHSIPFIGDKVSNSNNNQSNIKEQLCDQPTVINEKLNKSETEHEVRFYFVLLINLLCL